MKRLLATIAAAALSAAMVVVPTAGAMAAPPPKAGPPAFICPSYAPDGTDKIDTVGDPATVPFTAPDGYVIDYYCVQAGAEQFIIDVIPPSQSIEIDHPVKDSVSHYSVHWIAAPTASPTAPTFTDSECEPNDVGATQPGYLITATPNVTYTVSLNGGADAPATTGVFVPTNVGDQVTVTATANVGYQLKDYTGPWSHTFTDPGDCLVEVSVAPATKVDQVCVVGQDGAGGYTSGYITVPGSANVKYYIDGVLAAAGDHDLVPGWYEVTAVADAGYVLTGYTGPWDLEIVAAEPCGDLVVLPLVEPVVTFVQETCAAKGTYTLAVTDAENVAGVVWTVSGGLPNTVGTHSVATAGVVNITATPAGGYGFPGDTALLEWSFEFTSPGVCGDLTTLPLTGGGVAVGALGLGSMLLLAGALLAVARQRRMLADATQV